MESTTEKVKILSAGAISAMLRRMAYEVYERNFSIPTLLVAGIGVRGGFIADRLQAHLEEISPLRVERLDFLKPEDGQRLQWKQTPAGAALAGSTLLIVDDVLYSGNTMLQALTMVAALNPAHIQAAVLIDRGHHQYPVTHDYVGMEMATSLKQYISVEVNTTTQRAEAFIF